MDRRNDTAALAEELTALHRECLQLTRTRRDTEEAIGRNISRQLEILGADPDVLGAVPEGEEIKRALVRALTP